METGSTLSLNASTAIGSGSTIGRNYDQERQFEPVRDTHRARMLARIASIPEAATIIDAIATDAFSSQDGDDQGSR